MSGFQRELFLLLVIVLFGLVYFNSCDEGQDNGSDSENDVLDDDDDSELQEQYYPLKKCSTTQTPCEWKLVHQLEKPIGLHGIWGSSEMDIYAVGGDHDSNASAHLMHFDGTEWRKIPIEHSACLYDVWGSGPNDVYVVGGADGNELILHYNGSAWETLIDQYDHIVSPFRQVWGSGPDDVYALQNGAVWHFNGAYWIPLSDLPDDSIKFFSAVWGRSASEVYLSARAEFPGDYKSLSSFLLRFDGSQWTITNDVNDGLYVFDFSALGGAETGPIYFGHFYSLYTYDGQAWSKPLLFDEFDFTAIWAASEDDVQAVSDYGYAIHYNGDSWCQMESPRASWYFQDLWGAPDGTIYAAGTIHRDRGGVVLRCQ